MGVKIVFIINAVVYLLLGLAFIFIPAEFTKSMGTLPPLGEVFMRALGGTFVGLSIISWYAKQETKSHLFLGVVVGNLLAHFLQAGGDMYAIYRGILNTSGYTSIIIHIMLGLAFVYVFLKRKNVVEIVKVPTLSRLSSKKRFRINSGK